MMKPYLTILTLTTLLSYTSCQYSTPSTGPTAAERRLQHEAWHRTQLATEQRTLQATDSLLRVTESRLSEATQGFTYERTEYDDLGRYLPVGSTPLANANRSYLRAAVDDYGRTQLIATLRGQKGFVATQLRLTASDGTSVTTLSLPATSDSGTNYQGQIGGQRYQVLTFLYAGKITEGMTQDSTVLATADTDNGALAFLAAHVSDDRLTAALLSDQGQIRTLSLTARERKQMAAAFALGELLRERVRLKQENKTAALKIKYLQALIESKADTTKKSH